MDAAKRSKRKKPPAQQGWHKADIVAAVKKAGTNLSELSEREGFAKSTLRAALHKPHPNAQRAIAQAIGKTVHELWPQWFDHAGNCTTVCPRSAQRARRRNEILSRDQRAQQAA